MSILALRTVAPSHRRTVALCALIALVPSAFAQQFGNAWLTFAKDQTRIIDASGAAATAILNDSDEKDYAWGDVNHDGWIDLVIVRKEPVYGMTQFDGKRENYLLMNENGRLVDRTAQFAADSDVAGDAGFLTKTNDRDVQIADLNGDGWEDIVTSVAQSIAPPLMGTPDPKVISHPRIYMNKGTVGGSWQGFRYEAARIPQLYVLQAGSPTTPGTPNFCSVSIGDVTGDGAPDLYFTDYNEIYPVNLDDRLLVNDGAGNFTDSFQTRMTSAMLFSGFGTSSDIVDMNGDGKNDVVRGAGLHATIAYNGPTVGFFPLGMYQANIGTLETYHVDAGDLNKDGKPDLIFSSDGDDFYRYNTGNDGLGRVIWGPIMSYIFLSGADDSFAGNCLIADLNGDGWGEALYSDVDVDSVACGRRGKIYHNPGTVIGSQPSLIEEAEMSGATGWKGAVGILGSDMNGTFDIAAFDIDNDGDVDLVVGRCSGTSVFINQMLQPSIVICTGDGSGTPCPCGNNSPVANGAGCLSSLSLGGKLRSSGAARTTSDSLRLLATQVPNGAGQYFQSTSILGGGSGITFGDGLLCTGGTIARIGIKFASGNASSYPQIGDPNVSVAGGVAPGDTRSYQVWYRDSDLTFCASEVFNLTNALTLTWQM